MSPDDAALSVADHGEWSSEGGIARESDREALVAAVKTRQATPRVSKGSVIYFVQCNSPRGPIKIRYTSRAAAYRMKHFGTGNPYVIAVLGEIPGTCADEKVLGQKRSGNIRLVPAPRMRGRSLAAIRGGVLCHEDCWAKTTKEGNPGVNVSSHCRNVDCVAEAINYP